jgi:hypothetical protein
MPRILVTASFPESQLARQLPGDAMQWLDYQFVYDGTDLDSQVSLVVSGPPTLHFSTLSAIYKTKASPGTMDCLKAKPMGDHFASTIL